VKSRFNDWIVNRIKKYDLIENQDFVAFTKILVNGGREIDYALTLDTAKELAMVEGNEKGKQARQYFIACEKKLRQAAESKPLSYLDQAELMLKELRQQEARLSAVEDKVLEIEAQTATRPDYLTIMGFAIISKVKVSLTMAGQLGKKAKSICSQKGYHIDQIPDPRFGLVNVYPRDVLKQVFDTSFTR
jgi:anti-repressor protein